MSVFSIAFFLCKMLGNTGKVIKCTAQTPALDRIFILFHP